MNRTNKRAVGLSVVAVLVAAAWFGIQKLPEEDKKPQGPDPSLSNITAQYVTSTNEVVIGWQIDAVEISEYNTGVRYGDESHNSQDVVSSSYPEVQLATKTDSGYEVRIPITEIDEFFYRIQVSHNDEFFWSDEGIVLIFDDFESK